MNISVNPVIELLTIIQYLVGVDELNDIDSEYKSDINEYFLKFKNHKVIEKYIKLSKGGFSHDAPVVLLLATSGFPKLQLDRESNESLLIDSIKRAGGYKNALDFLNHVGDFYEVSNFQQFYENHTIIYNHMLNDFKLELNKLDFVNLLESYFGMSQKSYTVILSPMIQGGYGPRFNVENCKADVFCIMGPSDFVDNKFYFENIELYILHEFSHSFVNNLTEKFLTDVTQYYHLFSNIKEEMNNIAYGNWVTTVNEHIVRAIVARIALQEVGKELYDMTLEYEKSLGFAYIKKVVDKLEHYENNRNVYKNFEEYYHILISAFGS
ncbi:DUF4932 domain-containing protein [Mycoplasmatota bacterium WC44]